MFKESSSNVLPYLYEKWISQFMEDSIPAELAATCDSCVMCAPQERTTEKHEYYFNPSIKCCTYNPELPNFLIGAILADGNEDTAAGRGLLNQRLTSGIGVTPLGMSPPSSYTLLYRNSHAAFGRSQSLGCPYYVAQSGRCGIWRYRAPPCITWFCKHNRGAIGRGFWRELLQLMLSIQQNVALWCMTELDMDTDTLRSVLNQPQRSDAELNMDSNVLDGKADESWQRSVWGDWYGRQEEFYLRCARLAQELDWREVAAAGGPEVRIRAQIVKNAYRKLSSNDAPSRLRTGNFQVVNITDSHVRVTTYSPYDPLDIPKPVMEALAYFDGRPVTDALDIITEQNNISLNSKILYTLIDFGVLVEESENS